MCGSNKTTANTGEVWRPDNEAVPAPANPDETKLFRPDVLKTVEAKIKELDSELRALSLEIHANPELGYEEHHTHDVQSDFMVKHGFEVKKHHVLETAWEATFSHGTGGRVIGINSEMDALKGIGHACGHNLIGISGIAVAIALRAAMEQHDIPGKIILLGTPAEEGGSGKIALLDRAAYKGMDICVMCHPAPGPIGSVSLSSCLALERIDVEYSGHTAHAALSPWEGTNALDAAVLAYNNISALRQQLKPTHRVHGIIEGKDWAPNIIPDYSKFSCYVRAPTRAELVGSVKRVLPCFEAAATATGCQVTITQKGATYDLRQNKALGIPIGLCVDSVANDLHLGDEVANIVLNRYGAIDYVWGIASASTDFGNITYALPSLHPGFAIPSVLNGGNHTRAFAEAAATDKAHYACLDVSKALAGTAARVLLDDAFFAEVKRTFEEDRLIREIV
ncbi:hypothetical protein BDN72DRAFT_885678 [Pluteus cervinus]|uniref:Uncharacterized protein n=1 Tax=Pluteus cervinus TaxID=181527 RepID=A0ACD3BCI3_9AGAR|nr:hypothetical protein BDN72DRAFT_885678 [Pluteus cervinus]